MLVIKGRFLQYNMNSNYTIVSGTNRTGSNTLKIAQQYKDLLAQKGIEANLLSLENLDVSTRNDQIRDLETRMLVPTTKFIFHLPGIQWKYTGCIEILVR